jgi:hypothetical protein
VSITVVHEMVARSAHAELDHKHHHLYAADKKQTVF